MQSTVPNQVGQDLDVSFLAVFDAGNRPQWNLPFVGALEGEVAVRPAKVKGIQEFGEIDLSSSTRLAHQDDLPALPRHRGRQQYGRRRSSAIEYMFGALTSSQFQDFLGSR